MLFIESDTVDVKFAKEPEKALNVHTNCKRAEFFSRMNLKCMFLLCLVSLAW